jgi:hypothetical protein
MKDLFRLGAALLLSTGVAWSKPTPTGHYKDRPVYWLSMAQVQALADSVPPPPAAGSPADQADVAMVEKDDKICSPDAKAEAKRDEHFSTALFQPVLGPKFDAAHAPKVYEFCKEVGDDSSAVDGIAKNKWKRLRPYQAHKEIIALFPVEGMSYPSGHATAAYLFAAVLSQLYPARQPALMHQAALIAQSRVDAGVHYPTDIEEGQKLGLAIAQALLANPDFQKSLAEAKAAATTP